MKRVILCLVFFFAYRASVWATVDWTFAYDVYLYSSYLQNGMDFVKMDQSHNGNASTFYNLSQTPYNGGSDFQYRTDFEKYQLAALYLGRTGISNWTTNDVVGILSVGTSAAFPEGSLVPFEISYEYAEVENNGNYPEAAGISFWEDNFMHEIYSVSGKTVTTETLYLTAGQNYGFYAWYSVGDATHRLSGQFLGGILYNFEVIPEPTSFMLLIIGAGFLFKQRKTPL